MRNVLLASALVVALCGSAYAQHMPSAGVWVPPANEGLNWTPPQYSYPANSGNTFIVPNYNSVPMPGGYAPVYPGVPMPRGW
jgi:hypothetical protein